MTEGEVSLRAGGVAIPARYERNTFQHQQNNKQRKEFQFLDYNTKLTSQLQERLYSGPSGGDSRDALGAKAIAVSKISAYICICPPCRYS